MAIEKTKVDGYRKLLEEERARLLREVAQADDPVNFGDDQEDEDEEADEAEEVGNRLAVAHTQRDRLDEIDRALEKIAAGSYGTCDACGGEISERVLAAAPESALCESCKKSQAV